MSTPILVIDGLIHVLRRKKDNRDTFMVKVERKLEFHANSFTTILGPSGCGKTTLLTLLGLLRGAQQVTLFQFNDGKKIYNLTELWSSSGGKRKIEQLRQKHIGFALQNGELLESLTVGENIAVPMRLNGIPKNTCNERVEQLLADFELCEHDKKSRFADRWVNGLSGGESQRVQLARAIAHLPDIVFVDEPTSALNRDLARGALQLLRKNAKTVVMITHDTVLANEFSDRVITMKPQGETGVIDKDEHVGQPIKLVILRDDAVYRPKLEEDFTKPVSDEESAGVFNYFFKLLEPEDGKGNFYRFGTNEGEEVGWIEKKFVERWKTVQPQSTERNNNISKIGSSE